jgi:hypothetical protein
MALFSKDPADVIQQGGRTDQGRNCQFGGHVTDSEIPETVATFLRDHSKHIHILGTRLVRQSRNVFKCESIPGGLMVILSSGGPVDIQITTDFQKNTGDNTTVIVGHMSLESIEGIARVCGIQIMLDGDGVYKLE